MINFDEVTTMGIIIPQEYINCPRDSVLLTNVKFVHTELQLIVMTAKANISYTTGKVVDGKFVGTLNNMVIKPKRFYGSYPTHWQKDSTNVIGHILALVDYFLTNKGEDDITGFGSIANMLEDENEITQLTINHYMVGTMLMIDIDWADNDEN